jgi:thioredoxin 1
MSLCRVILDGREERYMNNEHEQFISGEDEELKRIRQKMLRDLTEKRQSMSGTEPFHVTDADFDKIVQENPIALIDFWASWCGPCKALAPVIEELAKEYVGKIFVGKLNVDENPGTAERFQVYSIPTVIVMKNGKEADRIVGLYARNYIENVLKKHMG